MGKIVRPIMGVVAVIAIIWAVRHMQQKRFVTTKLGPINAEYEEAKTPEQFTKLKQDYEALLGKVPSSHRPYVEGQVASCVAWLAFLDTSGRPSIRKYEDCIRKMEKAKELAGDKQGVWAKKLTEFRGRHKEALGPDVPKMQSEYARLSKMPFGNAMADLETLYRWRKIWHDQDMHLTDKAREGIFAQARTILLTNYCRMFEESIVKARKTKGKSEAALSAKAAPMGALARVRRFDEAKADAYAAKHAQDLEAAKKASKELEKLMEAMMPH